MQHESERIRLEFEEKNRLLRHEFLSQQLCVESLVAPTHRRTKGSCPTPTTSEDVIFQISQCELLIEDDIFPRWWLAEKSFKRPLPYITFLCP